MKKLFKWGCLVTLALVVVVVAMVWRQIGHLRENLEVTTPLAIVPVQPSAARVDRLTEKSTAAAADGVLRLTGPELTFIAQRAVRHPAAQAELVRGRALALAALAEIPDPLGFWQGLRLDQVDLRRLVADVEVVDQQLRLRATAPYPEGDRHLNVQLAVRGGWAPGSVRVDVTRLVVGEMDVLDLPLYGGIVRSSVDRAVAAATRLDHGGPLRDVRVDRDALVVRLGPDGARELASLARRYLR